MNGEVNEVGIDPEVPNPSTSQRLPPLRRGRWLVPVHIVLAIDFILLTFNLGSALVAGAVLLFASESEMAERIRELLDAGMSSGGVWLSIGLALVGYGLIPLVWTLVVSTSSRAGLAWLGLRMRDAGRAVAQGAGLGLALVAGIVVLATIQTWLGVPPTSNATVEPLLAIMTWPLAVFIALAAGIGEEIFFRGMMQRWLGWWGQGILFGLAHVTGGDPAQIIAALAIGLLFGWLRHKDMNLAMLITAHAVYNFMLLATFLLSVEFL